MSELPNQTEFRPALFRDALRRHIGLILGFALLFAVPASGAGVYLTGTHTSSAVVLVNPLYGNPFSPATEGDQLTSLETEAQLVSTDAVAAIAAKALNTTVSPSDLVRTARATVTTNTQVIRIHYEAPTADTAQDRAQAFAEAYLVFREQRARELITNQVKLLRQQESSTRDLLVKATNQIGSGKGRTPAQAFATEQVRTYTAELTRLASEIAEEQAIPADPGQVISPADRPADGALSSGILYGVGGLLLGLIFGILAALARERLDDRVRGGDDLEQLSIMSLGEMSIPPNWSPTFPTVPEDHRRVRTALLSALPTVPATILIGRPGTSSQASTIIGALAIALIRSGARVCVIDSVASGWLGQDLIPPGGDGLATILLSDVPVDSVLQQPVSGLWVIPRGQWTDEAADQLGNARMRRAITSLRKQFDIVIINASGIENADSQVLARMADSVIIECLKLDTRHADLVRAVEQLGRGAVPVLGGVLVQPGLSRRRLARTRHPATTTATTSATALTSTAQPTETGPRSNERVPPQANKTSPAGHPRDGLRPEPHGGLMPVPNVAVPHGSPAAAQSGTNGPHRAVQNGSNDRNGATPNGVNKAAPTSPEKSEPAPARPPGLDQ